MAINMVCFVKKKKLKCIVKRRRSFKREIRNYNLTRIIYNKMIRFLFFLEKKKNHTLFIRMNIQFENGIAQLIWHRDI